MFVSDLWHVYAFVSLLYSKKRARKREKKIHSHISLSQFTWFFDSSFFDRFFSFFLLVIEQQKRQITITKCATKEDKSLENWICWILNEWRKEWPSFVHPKSIHSFFFSFAFQFFSFYSIDLVFISCSIDSVFVRHMYRIIKFHLFTVYLSIFFFFFFSSGYRLFHNISFSCIRHIYLAQVIGMSFYHMIGLNERADISNTPRHNTKAIRISLLTLEWLQKPWVVYRRTSFLLIFSRSCSNLENWIKGCIVFFFLFFQESMTLSTLSC